LMQRLGLSPFRKKKYKKDGLWEETNER
jgi:hypothetical protein